MTHYAKKYIALAQFCMFIGQCNERLNLTGERQRVMPSPTVIEIPQKAPPDLKKLREEFNELATTWYRETAKLSSAEQMVLHPAYQKIIGMGRDALPFIFKELKKTRGHWIWALAMITRDDKATPGMKFREAVDAWLAWGESNGYI